jgi:hypothetical protein
MCRKVDSLGVLENVDAEPESRNAWSAKCRLIDLAEIAPACRISRARVVNAGRIVTADGIASGMELGFHLLRRAGYDEGFISDQQ